MPHLQPRAFLAEKGIWRCLLAALTFACLEAAPCLHAQEPAAQPTDLPGAAQPPGEQAIAKLLAGEFNWQASAPLVTVQPDKLPPSPDNPWHAVKDPSVVFHDGRWHLFCTLRKQRGGDGKPPGYIRIGYVSFESWEDAPLASWQLLELSPGYHGAPQVFYYAPQQLWYLVYQLENSEKGLDFGPYFSTTQNLNDPATWTPPSPLYPQRPDNITGWLDFWVICDADQAHLFFTSLDGRLWRAETPRAKFPRGFSKPEIALQADIFEASHTYQLAGLNQYLTLVEAQGASGGRGQRYYKAFLADRLEGPWKELASSADRPFAGAANVTDTGPRWTDSFSHGELLRTNNDERLLVDPGHLRFLFQGIADKDWGPYGQLGWRLGILTPSDQQTPGN